MHACDNDNDVAVHAIEDSVGEPMEKRPSGISMNYRVHGRMSGNTLADRLHGRQELITQARTLALIPEKYLINICKRPQAGQ